MDAASIDVYARDGDSSNPMIIAVPSDGPYTTHALTANLVFRVLLAVIANLVCLVPLRLLHRNGEFAAVVFILTMEFKNIETMLNALIWRDDNVAEWFPGYGLCDMGSFIDNFANGVYATCLLAIMRNLAQQVGLLRANPMTAGEKRQRNLVQALIIFPVPLLMVGMTWPLSAQRYAVGTLVGCLWVADPSWPYLITFVLPHILIPLATTAYAILTYFRYREVAKTTQSALSRNRVANQRAQRTRRRLYLMVISVLTPFLPLTILMFVHNVLAVGNLTPYNYDKMHNNASPYPWNSVVYLTHDQISFQLMNVPYIAILTAIPVFVFFGTTKDAMNDYRKLFLWLGLGSVFPKLNEEYDPDRSARADMSWSFGSSAFNTNNTRNTSKLRSIITTNPLSSFSSSSGGRRPSDNVLSDAEQGQAPTIQPPPAAHQPSVDLSSTAEGSTRGLLSRNPFPFRTHLALPLPFTLSLFKTSKSPSEKPQATPPTAVHMDNLPQDQQQQQQHKPADKWNDPSGISTRVWSEEETRLWPHGQGHTRDRRSVGSADGVVVETMFTRETEVANAEANPKQQQQKQR